MRGPDARALVVLVTALLLAQPGLAFAAMQASTPAVAPTYSTLTVGPAGTPAAATACGPVGSFTATVTLSWTGSSTTRLTGVQVLRAVSPLGYSVVASLSAASTGYVDTGLSVATSYQYVVRSLVTTFSADSPATTITTPSVCL